jgi:type II secretory ATPase GspE/PulE/Tfp pilus assembly ATPase PilB-like protein
MIGEIRDIETARNAMRASLTGHLVLSTLHTNDAPSAFWRLRDIGIESYLVAATMKLVIAQRLVRMICEDCKAEIVPTQEMRETAIAVNADAANWKFYQGAGCPKCNHTGYRGRTAILEFLEASGPILDMVLNGSGAAEFRRKAIELGMEPLISNGMDKVRRGITTVDEVMSMCVLEEVG